MLAIGSQPHLQLLCCHILCPGHQRRRQLVQICIRYRGGVELPQLVQHCITINARWPVAIRASTVENARGVSEDPLTHALHFYAALSQAEQVCIPSLEVRFSLEALHCQRI